MISLASSRQINGERKTGRQTNVGSKTQTERETGRPLKRHRDRQADREAYIRKPDIQIPWHDGRPTSYMYILPDGRFPCIFPYHPLLPSVLPSVMLPPHSISPSSHSIHIPPVLFPLFCLVLHQPFNYRRSPIERKGGL